MTRIPAKLFLDYSPKGALFTILKTAYAHKEQMQWRSFNLEAKGGSKREENIGTPPPPSPRSTYIPSYLFCPPTYLLTQTNTTQPSSSLSNGPYKTPASGSVLVSTLMSPSQQA